MIDRRKFIKLLGLTLPAMSVLPGCNDSNNTDTNNSADSGTTTTTDSVLIIGAGAAGMAAGHLLAQKGVDFKILEASSSHGGRMKHNTDFANFPVSLGAEWLHVDESELATIVNDSSVQITTRMQSYTDNDTYGRYSAGNLEMLTVGELGALVRETAANDKSFVDSSWLSFFEQYILPSVEANITFNTQVTSIDYQDTIIHIQDQNGQTYQADKVIVTVPAKILQNGGVSFTPALPDEKLSTLQEAEVWGGFKYFIEFSEKFYPTFLELTDIENSYEQHLYYDAAYAQNSSAHVLGLFSVGAPAEPYQALSGDAQRDYILNELDQAFDGQASQYYIKHIAQDWNAEPYIRSAYLAGSSSPTTPRKLGTAIDNKVYFAGEAYAKELFEWGGVHSAGRSARDAVEAILGRVV